MEGIDGGGEGASPDVYFRVEHIQAGVARVRELGGQAGDPEEIASGYTARCRDDQGVRFGLWAPASPP